MKIRSNEIVVICGAPGEGKTYLAKSILHRIKRHLVYDINDEYQGFNRVVPTGRDDLDKFLKIVYHNGNITAVFDEADLVFNRFGTLQDDAYKVVHLHRHRNIGIIAITRRFANLHKDLVGLADHVFIFRLFTKNDVDWLRFFCGDAADLAPQLKDYHFLHYSKGSVQECPPV